MDHSRLASVALILLSATAFAIAQEGKQGDKKPTTPNYYPLEVGNTWHYKVTANGKESSVTTSIGKHEKIDDLLLARLDSGGSSFTEHLTQTDKGVFRHRYNGAEVTPAFDLVRYPATVGTKWKGRFTVEKEQGRHMYQAEILREETVDVPAGKFKAIVVQIKLDEGDKQVETNYWFVQDVGFVKQTFTVAKTTILLELEKFDRKK